MRRDTLSAEFVEQTESKSALAGPKAFLQVALPFANIRVAPGRAGQETAEESAFAPASKLKDTGFLFDLEPYAKPEEPLFFRADFEVKTPGSYIVGMGADWYTVVRVDGKVVLDCSEGNVHYPPKVTNHQASLELTAGRHVLDIRFIRGEATAQLCVCIFPAAVLGDGASSADFGRTVGKVNPLLHNSNSAPDIHIRSIRKNDEELRRMNFGMSRTHDWALWTGGQRIIDTHFIFPLMKLDPKDPTNYYFDATDEALRVCQEEAGIKIFYRLGTSIEHTEGRHFNTLVPDDFDKYAEVLAGIVRHYTRGWANGFHYDIRYWEIWNEANLGPKMWCGDFDSFVTFFVTVLKRLKSEFPELKIGGPALTGLSFACIRKLLDACTKAGIKPDFLSWHCYTADPDRLTAQPASARNFLDDAGFKETETCINEWHYLETWEGVHSNVTIESFRRNQNVFHGANSAAFNIAVLSGWQYTTLDTAFYYGARWEGNWGYITADRQLDKNFYSMCLMGDMIRDYTELCPVENRGSVRLMAAKSADGKSAALLISDFRGQTDSLEIDVRGLDAAKIASAVKLDENADNQPVSVQWNGKKLRLAKAAGSAVFMVRFSLN